MSVKFKFCIEANSYFLNNKCIINCMNYTIQYKFYEWISVLDIMFYLFMTMSNSEIENNAVYYYLHLYG